MPWLTSTEPMRYQSAIAGIASPQDNAVAIKKVLDRVLIWFLPKIACQSTRTKRCPSAATTDGAEPLFPENRQAAAGTVWPSNHRRAIPSASRNTAAATKNAAPGMMIGAAGLTK